VDGQVSICARTGKGYGGEKGRARGNETSKLAHATRRNEMNTVKRGSKLAGPPSRIDQPLTWAGNPLIHIGDEERTRVSEM
jgi:hypothetical protein